MITAKDTNPGCPGSKIRSKGKGRGLGKGRGKGPINYTLSKIPTEHTLEILHQAQMRGIEHDVLPLEDEDWVAIQFTTNNSRASFDSMVTELGYDVFGTNTVQVMLDQVLAGREASDLVEGLTKGIKNALSKGRVKSTCDCGFSVPVYGGRYPDKCPECGNSFSKDEG